MCLAQGFGQLNTLCHAAHGCRNADQVVNLLLGGTLLADGVLVGSHAVRATVHGRNCERQHLKVELVDTAVFTDDLHAQVCTLIVVGAVEEAAGAVEDVVHSHDGCRAECRIEGGFRSGALSPLLRSQR